MKIESNRSSGDAGDATGNLGAELRGLSSGAARLVDVGSAGRVRKVTSSPRSNAPEKTPEMLPDDSLIASRVLGGSMAWTPTLLPLLLNDSLGRDPKAAIRDDTNWQFHKQFHYLQFPFVY